MSTTRPWCSRISAPSHPPSWELASGECYYPNGGGWDGAEILLHHGRVVDIGTSGVGCYPAPNTVIRDLRMATDGCGPVVQHPRHHECTGKTHGAVGHGASTLEVWIPQGRISCGEAEKVMSSLWYGTPYRGIYHCYNGGTNCPH